MVDWALKNNYLPTYPCLLFVYMCVFSMLCVCACRYLCLLFVYMCVFSMLCLCACRYPCLLFAAGSPAGPAALQPLPAAPGPYGGPDEPADGRPWGHGARGSADAWDGPARPDGRPGPGRAHVQPRLQLQPGPVLGPVLFGLGGKGEEKCVQSWSPVPPGRLLDVGLKGGVNVFSQGWCFGCVFGLGCKGGLDLVVRESWTWL